MQFDTSTSLDRRCIDYTSRNMQVAAVNSKEKIFFGLQRKRALTRVDVMPNGWS